jgi:hypothetical protein
MWHRRGFWQSMFAPGVNCQVRLHRDTPGDNESERNAM